MVSSFAAAAIVFLLLAAWIAVEHWARSHSVEPPEDCPAPEATGRCGHCALEEGCGLTEASPSENQIEVFKGTEK